jgi:adenylosuccinate lyase
MVVLERYSRPAMRKVWSEENKMQAYLQVELLACEVWHELGVIPLHDLERLLSDAKIDLKRMQELELETKHDVIAFTRAVSESLGDEKKWIHYGLTSTDVVDTAYGYLYAQANMIIMDGLMQLSDTLKTMALRYKSTPQIGRTHGIHAEVTSFGLKMALFYDECQRHLMHFNSARQMIEVGKISGAVGTFANTPPFLQDSVCERLGIGSVNISTQVLQRDRHAYYFSILGLISTFLEQIAMEIRHLQRTEVAEVMEAFGKKQKGSSAMPHKKNPIGSENICGCARVMRGYMLTSFENVPLWHERDISHSSAERIIAPDATMLLDYMLHRMNQILSGLIVDEARMLKNIDLTYGVIYSQRFVLKLIDHGVSREAAYDLVQPYAIKAWEDKIAFKTLIVEDAVIKATLTDTEIDDCFDLGHHLVQVDEIYRRVGLI